MMIGFFRRKASGAGSSTLAIGTATTFALLTAGLSLVADRDGPAGIGTNWMLRGAVAPSDRPNAATPVRADVPKPRKLA